MKKILGYCDDWSHRAGQKVEFKISTFRPKAYDAALVRVTCRNPDLDHGIFEDVEIDASFKGTYVGHTQPANAGTCAVVPWPGTGPSLTSFTAQA